MTTRLPTVRVTRTEARGWMVTCGGCPDYRRLTPFRNEADAWAHYHRASHQQPEREVAS